MHQELKLGHSADPASFNIQKHMKEMRQHKFLEFLVLFI